MSRKRAIQTNIRLSPDERDKLLELADRTDRNVSEVVRLLIRHAEVVPSPDIQSDWPVEPGDGRGVVRCT